MRKKFNFKLFILAPILTTLFLCLSFFTVTHSENIFNLLNNLPQIFYTPQILHTEASKSKMLEISEVSSESRYNLEEIEERIKNKILKELQDTTLSQTTARKLLETTVEINRNGSTGSGVVVFQNRYNGIYYSYIITNQHVVADSSNVTVTRFTYINDSKINSKISYEGKVINVDKNIDLALIELQTSESIGPSAHFDTDDLETHLKLYQQIYVVGCPLGNAPLITNGNVAHISNVSNIITAFSIFGSSGGGVFDHKGRLVSIVRGVALLQTEKSKLPVPGITYAIPGVLVKSWLISNGFSFVMYDGTHELYLMTRSLFERHFLKEKSHR